jgi:rhamnosyltransferase
VIDRVSIVVPTRNGMATLPSLLAALKAQMDTSPRQIIAIDSESTDGTREFLGSQIDRVLEIPAAAFNHATARNRALEEADGDFAVLIVQDAIPMGTMWLTALLAPLRADPDVAGTFARQQARPNASAITRHMLASWVAASPQPRTASLGSAGDLTDRSPMERLRYCAFDNVCSAVRMSVWRSHPFPDVPIAEDLAWAKTVLLAGSRLAYVPDALVTHSHDRAASYELARTWVLHQRLHHLFGLRTIPSMRALARAIPSALVEHLAVLRQARVPYLSRDAARALALAFAWPLGQYLGGWTAAHHRDAWRPRGV